MTEELKSLPPTATKQGEPVIRASVAHETRNRRVEIAGEEDDEHVVDQVLRIEVDSLFRNGFPVCVKSLEIAIELETLVRISFVGDRVCGLIQMPPSIVVPVSRHVP